MFQWSEGKEFFLCLLFYFGHYQRERSWLNIFSRFDLIELNVKCKDKQFPEEAEA